MVSRVSMPTMLRDRLWAGLRDLQVRNVLRHRKDAINFEEIMTEARTLEEVNKVEELERMIKKRQTRAQLEQRKDPFTCNRCGIPGHLLHTLTCSFYHK